MKNFPKKSLKFINNYGSRYCFSTTSSGTNSVDQAEMKYFSNVSDWWKPSGSMSALWSYNIARIKFMKKIIL